MKTYFITPGGNPTILVDNLKQDIDRKNYAQISKQIIKTKPQCEQVGFIEKGETGNFRCQMMGGEFCVNALRSLGFWIFNTFGEIEFELESSGTKQLFKIQIEQWVSIELPKKYSIKKLGINLQFILLDGIGHFVQNIDSLNWNEKEFKEDFLKIQKKYSSLIRKLPAIGYIGVDKNNRIYPLIFVKDTESFIFESACGSGTLAAFLAKNKEENCFVQPSGFSYLIKEKKNNFVLKSKVSVFSDLIK